MKNYHVFYPFILILYYIIVQYIIMCSPVEFYVWEVNSTDKNQH